MRDAKNRRHIKAQARRNKQAYLKNNKLTSKSTINRRARAVMDSLGIPYVIIDGIICTYIALIL